MPSPDPTINTITLSNTLSVLPQLGLLVSYLKDGVTGFGQNETCCRHFVNVEIIRETTICIVTETEESDVPDKQQRDGIGGKASVNVAIGGETSLNVAIGRETSVTVAAVANNFEQAVVSADRCSQHRQTQSAHHATRPQFGATQTRNLHENCGTVEYFAGQ